jgi:hypothetical protein
MRFEGVKKDVGDLGTDGFGKDGRIYDHNTCVWHGFACGINYQDAQFFDPKNDQQNLALCFEPGVDGAPPQWMFLNSSTCAKTKDNRETFYIARFLLPCTNRDSGCDDGGMFGFFEIVDAPNVDFAEFRRQVVTANPKIFPNNPAPFDAVNQNGQYRMFGGGKELILFSAIAHKADPTLAGVLAVNDQPMPRISAWPLADGDVLSTRGDGIITFTNPNTKQQVIWDFSDAQHPKRQL